MGICISHRNQSTSISLIRQLKIGKRRLHDGYPGIKARIDPPQQAAKSYDISKKGSYTSLLGGEAVRYYGIRQPPAVPSSESSRPRLQSYNSPPHKNPSRIRPHDCLNPL